MKNIDAWTRSKSRDAFTWRAGSKAIKRLKDELGVRLERMASA